MGDVCIYNLCHTFIRMAMDTSGKVNKMKTVEEVNRK